MSLTGRMTTSRVQSMGCSFDLDAICVGGWVAGLLVEASGSRSPRQAPPPGGRSPCRGGAPAGKEPRVSLAEVAHGAQQNRAAAAEDEESRRGAGGDADRQEDHAGDEAQDVGDAGEARADDEQHVRPFGAGCIRDMAYLSTRCDKMQGVS